MSDMPALFFDLDDTLLDDNASSRRCMELTCAEFRGITPEFDEVQVAQTFYDIAQAHWRHQGIGLYSEMEIRIQLWEQALEQCGIKIAGAGRDFAIVYSKERARVVMPYDEAIPVLQELHGRFRMAVITNGHGDTQREKLALAGMAGFFDAVIASTDIGTGKPDQLIFDTALRALDADPATTWHIGDNLSTDVGGALDAGLKAAWLNRYAYVPESHHRQPTAEVSNLREFLALLNLTRAE